MADEKKLNLNIVPARLNTESSQELQKDTRFRMIKGLKWVALAVFVLFMLDSAFMKVFMSIHQCPYQNGIQVVRCVLMDRPKNRKYMEAKQNVTEEEAREMLTNGKMRTVIDGHNDLPYMIRLLYGNQIYKNFDFMHLPYHVDGTRLEKSNVLGTFWSVFVGCPKSDFDENGVEFGDAIYADAVKETFQQVDLVKRLIEQNHFMLLKTTSTYDFNGNHGNAVECWFRTDASPNDIDACLFEEIFSSEHNLYYNRYDGGDWGKVGRRFSFSPNGWLWSMMGAEGLHQIGNSVANLRGLYELGVRYMTLTHGCNNRYADSATALRGARWGGLSAEGREVVREMNRMGMLVDLSHVSADVMREVLGGVSRAPVMFSHSSVFALCPHPRNVPDDVLHLVKENNGVVMVNFYPLFVSCGPGKVPANATLEMVVDHIEYIGKLIGWEHVGIGSDFDGIESVPAGLEDVSKYPDLTVELLRRGVKSIDVVKVMGLNILRVWRAVEIVSKEMRHNGVLPMEDKFVKVEVGRTL